MRTKTSFFKHANLLVLAFLLSSAPSRACYRHSAASFDGTGKFFMGREISQVMGHEGIDWLERDKRDSEEAPSRAVAALALKPTDVVADIGAGSGYHAFRIAPLVPQGRVVAVDIQPEMLTILQSRAEELSVKMWSHTSVRWMAPSSLPTRSTSPSWSMPTMSFRIPKKCWNP
jgi:hypothetical protein